MPLAEPTRKRVPLAAVHPAQLLGSPSRTRRICRHGFGWRSFEPVDFVLGQLATVDADGVVTPIHFTTPLLLFGIRSCCPHSLHPGSQGEDRDASYEAGDLLMKRIRALELALGDS